ncbi:MAG TPA: hypothetical protein VGN09_12140 [Vicinamibacteria bacterium]
MRAAAVLLLVTLGVPVAAATGEIPTAIVVLEVFGRNRPDDVPESAPARFVLMEDGQVFVGGTSRVAAGRLSSAEVKALDRRAAEVRRVPGLAGTVRLGGGDGRQRLLLRRGRPLDMTVVGDTSQAAPLLRPLAALIDDLARFDHPSLRPYEPGAYAVSAREAALAGGCRTWSFKESPAESIFAPRTVPGESLHDWPTGASPASVCVGDKTYVVTFRPLLPGERP